MHSLTFRYAHEPALKETIPGWRPAFVFHERDVSGFVSANFWLYKGYMSSSLKYTVHCSQLFLTVLFTALILGNVEKVSLVFQELNLGHSWNFSQHPIPARVKKGRPSWWGGKVCFLTLCVTGLCALCWPVQVFVPFFLSSIFSLYFNLNYQDT